MRIVVLNDYGHVNGGASQVAISSLNSLAEAGLDVTFVSSVGPIDPRIDQSSVKTVNFGFHSLVGNPSLLQSAVTGIWDPRSAGRLRTLLREYNPRDTLIHLHGWTQSLSSSVVRAAAGLGFKVVCTLHDYFSVCPNGGLYNFPQRSACKLQPMSIRCVTCNCDSRSYAHKLWRVGRQSVQIGFGNIPNGIKYFITVSDYSESILRPFLGSNARFFRIRNPIDIEKLPPSTVGDQSTFTFVGRLSPEKGAEVFAAASRMTRVRASFLGTGDDAQRISAINPSAELVGWKSRTEVVRAIQKSRAVVFPSLWHETQGMAVLEAAALGVPVIVSDSCAAKEAVIDGKTGLLFRSGDVSDLSAKLELLDRDPALAVRLGQGAYQHYWSDPSTMESHVKQLISCYMQIVDPPNQSPA